MRPRSTKRASAGVRDPRGWILPPEQRTKGLPEGDEEENLSKLMRVWDEADDGYGAMRRLSDFRMRATDEAKERFLADTHERMKPTDWGRSGGIARWQTMDLEMARTLLERYESGVSVKALAAEHGLHWRAVYYRIWMARKARRADQDKQDSICVA